MDLAQAGFPFTHAVDEQMSEMRKLRGLSPIGRLMWEEVVKSLTRSLEPTSAAYRRIRKGEGTRYDVDRYILFITRCVEAWRRHNWPWPWDIKPPPPWAEPGVTRLRGEIIPLLPPPGEIR